MSRNTSLLLPLTVLVAASAGYGLRVYAENVPVDTPLFYAGTLEEDGKLVDGTRSLTLSIWDREMEGTMVCSSTTEKLPVTAGRFRMALSDACVAELRGGAKSADVYVAISFKDEGGVPHDVPGRTKIGAVPFALKAESASTASGALAGQVVPAGMIAMFAGACPAGWAEYQALRGRVPRGEPMGNAGALDMGGSDDAVVVSHVHTGSAAGGDHEHSATTGGQSQTHNHGGSTGGSTAWNSCRVFSHGGPSEVFEPSVYSSTHIGDNCSYRDKTLHSHPFVTDVASADHTHDVTLGGGAHAHALTTAEPAGSVGRAGQNMQAYREVLFCIKQ